MNTQIFVSAYPGKRYFSARSFYKIAKRSLDLGIALPGIVLLFPLFLFVALLIKFDSKGGVFYHQLRHGHDGKIFRLHKLRTMYVHHCDEGQLQASRKDKRITRVGYWLRKYAIDELPQLMNVIKGEMSLVGPRPHPVPLDHFYAQHVFGYWQRYYRKPGMTGWAQINGWYGETPTLSDMEERISHDVYYIRQQNLWLDVRILIKTVFLIFKL